ncbi:endonuclease/exonuclease/phosphatase family protein [Galbibacter pacificus]|uniref:Endonuclease/exonuclease/phosphatase family protein n=2 Tax=Galbibacter TaxID=379068 RepID=A0ABT6FNT3_9FLAO|nr:endonuclease/exonuclease/phosphatase family protein [Galbibacter pacificus]MDG3581349.1 endonuclease/exonuclease/phosphatase family protein [Galbibacter pacificus]MDG3584827.1 endonuclease/exonuclease/phosphatase family protein [Galbibacter pacificus]
MKKLNWFHKTLFLVNSVFAFLLLLSLLVPYVPIKSFPKIAIFSLATPILIILNILFMGYWIIRLKKQWLLSFFVLLLGYQQVASLYKFSGKQNVATSSALKVMTYNVRVFDVYKWIGKDGVFDDILGVIKQENPDILCLQEFYYTKEKAFKFYPYRFVKYKTKETGQAIYSKFPIINKGSLNFPNSGNNAIYADIVKDNDTIRVYNLHMQSFHINPQDEEISQENSGRLARRMGAVFSKQQIQTNIFVSHKEKCPYKTITCGDLNNNQYSAIYNQIKGNDVDTFDEQGSGTGKTYYFKYFPFRIDFILVDEAIPVISHKNRYELLSDHYPVISQLKI